LKLNALRRISSFFVILIIVLFTISSINFAQSNARTELKIPDIAGYKTLKCDFHMHTVFSDGDVWPTVRVEEAWREGLDAIAITDHIEVQPHKKDIPTQHNRSYEIAKPKAEELGIILIKGVEITKSMPPGHFNAIFIEDANALDSDDWREAIKAANEQGAFVIWNHPGWEAQAPNGAKWWDEHTELYEKGWFKGIEIVNWYSYYPTVHQWALEKNLTMLGNSDVHPPTNLAFNFCNGGHRPMTFVFAEDKSEAAIKEALLKKRTAVYFNELLIGEKKFLKPIVEQAIEILNPKVSVKGKGRAYIQIYNKSDLTFNLAADRDLAELSIPSEITFYPGKTSILQIKSKSTDVSGKRSLLLPYSIKNLLVAPDTGLPIDLAIEVDFVTSEN